MLFKSNILRDHNFLIFHFDCKLGKQFGILPTGWIIIGGLWGTNSTGQTKMGGVHEHQRGVVILLNFWYDKAYMLKWSNNPTRLTAKHYMRMETKSYFWQFYFHLLPGCIWHWPRVLFPFCRTEEACRRTPRRGAAAQRWPGTWPAGSPVPHRWPAAGREQRNKHCSHRLWDDTLHI